MILGRQKLKVICQFSQSVASEAGGLSIALNFSLWFTLSLHKVATYITVQLS